MRKTMTKLAGSLAIAGFVAVSLTACGGNADQKMCDSAKSVFKEYNAVKDPAALAADPTKMKEFGDKLVKIAADNSSAESAPGLKATGEMMQLSAEAATATTSGDTTKMQELSTKITELTSSAKADMDKLNEKCKIAVDGS